MEPSTRRISGNGGNVNSMPLARMAVKIFPRTDYNQDQVKHLRRSWMKSVNELADKWIVAPANQVQRKAS